MWRSRWDCRHDRNHSRHPNRSLAQTRRALEAASRSGNAMRIDFPFAGYEDIQPVEVPDSNLMGVFSPPVEGDVDENAVLAHAFAEPIGAPRLSEALRSASRVLIL